MQLEHLISLLVLSFALYLMIRAGVSKHALEPRRKAKTCPSCGRVVHDCCCLR